MLNPPSFFLLLMNIFVFEVRSIDYCYWLSLKAFRGKHKAEEKKADDSDQRRTKTTTVTFLLLFVSLSACIKQTNNNNNNNEPTTMLYHVLDFKRPGACLVRTDVPSGKGDSAEEEGPQTPVVAALCSCMVDGSGDFHRDFGVECAVRSDMHEKAASITKAYLEKCLTWQEHAGNPTDWSYLWPQTAPLPPTAMMHGPFSLLPLLHIRPGEGDGGAPSSASGPRQYQLLYEYYTPLLRVEPSRRSPLLLWNSFTAAVNAVHLATSAREREGYTLLHYLSPSSRKVSGAAPCAAGGAAFTTGQWGEDLLWRLFASLLSALALHHSNGFSFGGRIAPTDVLCFAAPLQLQDELHDVMCSVAETIQREGPGADQGRSPAQEAATAADFDRLLSSYERAAAPTVLLPQCRLMPDTPAQQVFFVLTSDPISTGRRGPRPSTPHAGLASQMQDLAAVRALMEAVLLDQRRLGPSDDSAPDLPRNQELEFLLRCLEPARLASLSPPAGEDEEVGPDTVVTSALCPSAVQLLQLQALRLRQAGWLWQAVAETSCFELHRGRREQPTPLPSKEVQVGESWPPARRHNTQSSRSPSTPGTQKPTSTPCRACAALHRREAQLNEREKKLAALLELYELTQEQLDALPDARTMGYEELRRRLTQHLLLPPGARAAPPHAHSTAPRGSGGGGGAAEAPRSPRYVTAQQRGRAVHPSGRGTSLPAAAVPPSVAVASAAVAAAAALEAAHPPTPCGTGVGQTVRQTDPISSSSWLSPTPPGQSRMGISTASAGSRSPGGEANPRPSPTSNPAAPHRAQPYAVLLDSASSSSSASQELGPPVDLGATAGAAHPCTPPADDGPLGADQQGAGSGSLWVDQRFSVLAALRHTFEQQPSSSRRRSTSRSETPVSPLRTAAQPHRCTERGTPVAPCSRRTSMDTEPQNEAGETGPVNAASPLTPLRHAQLGAHEARREASSGRISRSPTTAGSSRSRGASKCCDMDIDVDVEIEMEMEEIDEAPDLLLGQPRSPSHTPTPSRWGAASTPGSSPRPSKPVADPGPLTPLAGPLRGSRSRSRSSSDLTSKPPVGKSATADHAGFEAYFAEYKAKVAAATSAGGLRWNADAVCVERGPSPSPPTAIHPAADRQFASTLAAAAAAAPPLPMARRSWSLPSTRSLSESGVTPADVDLSEDLLSDTAIKELLKKLRSRHNNTNKCISSGVTGSACHVETIPHTEPLVCLLRSFSFYRLRRPAPLLSPLFFLLLKDAKVKIESAGDWLMRPHSLERERERATASWTSLSYCGGLRAEQNKEKQLENDSLPDYCEEREKVSLMQTISNYSNFIDAKKSDDVRKYGSIINCSEKRRHVFRRPEAHNLPLRLRFMAAKPSQAKPYQLTSLRHRRPFSHGHRVRENTSANIFFPMQDGLSLQLCRAYAEQLLGTRFAAPSCSSTSTTSRKRRRQSVPPRGSPSPVGPPEDQRFLASLRSAFFTQSRRVQQQQLDTAASLQRLPAAPTPAQLDRGLRRVLQRAAEIVVQEGVGLYRHAQTEPAVLKALHLTGDAHADAFQCTAVTLASLLPAYWELLEQRSTLLRPRLPTLRCRRCDAGQDKQQHLPAAASKVVVYVELRLKEIDATVKRFALHFSDIRRRLGGESDTPATGTMGKPLPLPVVQGLLQGPLALALAAAVVFSVMKAEECRRLPALCGPPASVRRHEEGAWAVVQQPQVPRQDVLRRTAQAAERLLMAQEADSAASLWDDEELHALRAVWSATVDDDTQGVAKQLRQKQSASASAAGASIESGVPATSYSDILREEEEEETDPGEEDDDALLAYTARMGLGGPVELAAEILRTSAALRREKVVALLLFPGWWFRETRFAAAVGTEQGDEVYLHRARRRGAVENSSNDAVMPVCRPLEGHRVRVGRQGLGSCVERGAEGGGDKAEAAVLCCTPIPPGSALADATTALLDHSLFDPRRSLLIPSGCWSGGGGGPWAANLLRPLPPGLLTGPLLYHRLLLSGLWLCVYAEVLLPRWIQLRREHDDAAQAEGDAATEAAASIASCLSLLTRGPEERGGRPPAEVRPQPPTTTTSTTTTTAGTTGTSGTVSPFFLALSPAVLKGSIRVVQQAIEFKNMCCPVCDGVSSAAQGPAAARGAVGGGITDGVGRAAGVRSSLTWTGLQHAQTELGEQLRRYLHAADCPEAPLWESRYFCADTEQRGPGAPPVPSSKRKGNVETGSSRSPSVEAEQTPLHTPGKQARGCSGHTPREASLPPPSVALWRLATELLPHVVRSDPPGYPQLPSQQREVEAALKWWEAQCGTAGHDTSKELGQFVTSLSIRLDALLQCVVACASGDTTSGSGACRSSSSSSKPVAAPGAEAATVLIADLLEALRGRHLEDLIRHVLLAGLPLQRCAEWLVSAATGLTARIDVETADIHAVPSLDALEAQQQQVRRLLRLCVPLPDTPSSPAGRDWPGRGALPLLAPSDAVLECSGCFSVMHHVCVAPNQRELFPTSRGGTAGFLCHTCRLEAAALESQNEEGEEDPAGAPVRDARFTLGVEVLMVPETKVALKFIIVCGLPEDEPHKVVDDIPSPHTTASLRCLHEHVGEALVPGFPLVSQTSASALSSSRIGGLLLLLRFQSAQKMSRPLWLCRATCVQYERFLCASLPLCAKECVSDTFPCISIRAPMPDACPGGSPGEAFVEHVSRSERKKTLKLIKEANGTVAEAVRLNTFLCQPYDKIIQEGCYEKIEACRKDRITQDLWTVMRHPAVKSFLLCLETSEESTGNCAGDTETRKSKDVCFSRLLCVNSLIFYYGAAPVQAALNLLVQKGTANESDSGAATWLEAFIDVGSFLLEYHASHSTFCTVMNDKLTSASNAARWLDTASEIINTESFEAPVDLTMEEVISKVLQNTAFDFNSTTKEELAMAVNALATAGSGSTILLREGVKWVKSSEQTPCKMKPSGPELVSTLEDCLSIMDKRIMEWSLEDIKKWGKAFWAMLQHDGASLPLTSRMDYRTEIAVVSIRCAVLQNNKNVEQCDPETSTGLTWNLREPQVVAIALYFLVESFESNRIFQIPTGQGKSWVIAIIAACFSFLGKSVDVVCPSKLLAIRDAELFTRFYEGLNITCGCCCENSDDAPINKPRVYASHVVYGDLNSFSGDWLRSQFFSSRTRGERKFEVCIVDEVDNLLYDRRQHSVQLLDNTKGFTPVMVLLCAIWRAVEGIYRHIVEMEEEEVARDGTAVFKKNYYFIMSEFSRDPVTGEIHARKCNGELNVEYQRYKLEGTVRSFLKEQVLNYVQSKALHPPEKDVEPKAKEATDNNNNNNTKGEENETVDMSCDIPQHYRSFVDEHVSCWVNNAVCALLDYHCDHHYCILDNKIRVVDFRDTGGIHMSMKWSDGLHQFLELKHGLPLSSFGITKCFLSNVGLFKMYEGLYGMTGTLGDTSTRQFLVDIYGIRTQLELPSFRIISQKAVSSTWGPKNPSRHCPPRHVAKELTPFLANDDRSFASFIIHSCTRVARANRPVLLILPTIREALKFDAKLRAAEASLNVIAFTGKEEEFRYRTLKEGDIVVSTNIAGRGEDFRVSAEAERRGGLHVCIGFLPNTCRVESQNAGRTARQGNRGTFQLVFVTTASQKIMALLSKREAKEQAEAPQAANEASDMMTRDGFLLRFCNLITKLLEDTGDKEAKNLPESRSGILQVSENKKEELEALKEMWGRWLSHRSFEREKAEKNERDYEEFEKNVRDRVKTGTVIQHPHFFIAKGNRCLVNYCNTNESNDIARSWALQAQEAYEAAISLDAKNCFIAHFYKAAADIALDGKGHAQAILDLNRARDLIINHELPMLQTLLGLVQGHGNEALINSIVREFNYMQVVLHVIAQLCETLEASRSDVVELDKTSVITWKSFVADKGFSDQFDEAVALHSANGLHYLFPMKQIKPIPWGVVSFLVLSSLIWVSIGAAGLVYGGAFSAVGAGALACGVADGIEALQRLYSRDGNFDYMQHVTRRAVTFVVGAAFHYTDVATTIKNVIHCGDPRVQGAVKEGMNLLNRFAKEEVMKQCVVFGASMVLKESLSFLFPVSKKTVSSVAQAFVESNKRFNRCVDADVQLQTITFELNLRKQAAVTAHKELHVKRRDWSTWFCGSTSAPSVIETAFNTACDAVASECEGKLFGSSLFHTLRSSFVAGMGVKDQFDNVKAYFTAYDKDLKELARNAEEQMKNPEPISRHGQPVPPTECCQSDTEAQDGLPSSQPGYDSEPGVTLPTCRERTAIQTALHMFLTDTVYDLLSKSFEKEVLPLVTTSMLNFVTSKMCGTEQEKRKKREYQQFMQDMAKQLSGEEKMGRASVDLFNAASKAMNIQIKVHDEDGVVLATFGKAGDVFDVVRNSNGTFDTLHYSENNSGVNVAGPGSRRHLMGEELLLELRGHHSKKDNVDSSSWLWYLPKLFYSLSSLWMTNDLKLIRRLNALEYVRHFRSSYFSTRPLQACGHIAESILRDALQLAENGNNLFVLALKSNQKGADIISIPKSVWKNLSPFVQSLLRSGDVRFSLAEEMKVLMLFHNGEILEVVPFSKEIQLLNSKFSASPTRFVKAKTFGEKVVSNVFVNKAGVFVKEFNQLRKLNLEVDVAKETVEALQAMQSAGKSTQMFGKNFSKVFGRGIFVLSLLPDAWVCGKEINDTYHGRTDIATASVRVSDRVITIGLTVTATVCSGPVGWVALAAGVTYEGLRWYNGTYPLETVYNKYCPPSPSTSVPAQDAAHTNESRPAEST
eukprot:gene10888-7549_t